MGERAIIAGRFDARSMLIAGGVGLALQLTMVLAGHFVAVIREDGFAVGGMAFSIIAGLIYATRNPGGWLASARDGALAGGLSALIAIAASVAMKDTPAALLVFGAAASCGAGAVGATVGRLL